MDKGIREGRTPETRATDLASAVKTSIPLVNQITDTAIPAHESALLIGRLYDCAREMHEAGLSTSHLSATGTAAKLADEDNLMGCPIPDRKAVVSMLSLARSRDRDRDREREAVCIDNFNGDDLSEVLSEHAHATSKGMARAAEVMARSAMLRGADRCFADARGAGAYSDEWRELVTCIDYTHMSRTLRTWESQRNATPDMPYVQGVELAMALGLTEDEAQAHVEEYQASKFG